MYELKGELSIYRHAYRQHLNVVMPNEGHYLSTVKLFNRSIISGAAWDRLEMDVFTLHNRWNYAEVVNLMGPSVRTFSIVRHPVDLFESLYSYMDLKGFYGVDLKGFARLLRENRTRNMMRNNKERKFGYFGRNQLSWDLGIDPIVYDLPPESNQIQKLIAKLDQEFELVQNHQIRNY